MVGPHGARLSVGVVDGRNYRVSGSVFNDTNRNGRLDASETGPTGRTVFADYNFNGRFDADEPSTTTGPGGYYVLITRGTNVSVRLLLNAGETLSLPFGATSIWLPIITGDATGKNIGIVSTAASTGLLAT